MSLFNALADSSQPFVHKRLISGLVGFAKGGPISALTGFASGGGGRLRLHPDQTNTPSGSFRVEDGRLVRGRRADFLPASGGFAPPQTFAPITSGVPCLPPPFGGRDPVTGRCFIGTGPGIDVLRGTGADVGPAVMGQYGAGLAPGSLIIDRAVCLRGMVLGKDSICYNRSQIKNSERMWPRGRRPLLTGGDMRAISTAARAAARLERTTKRLQKIGLMKKPRPRQIRSGPTEHHHHT